MLTTNTRSHYATRGDFITLTPFWWWWAERIGASRAKQNRGRGITDQRAWRRDTALRDDALGVAAELAFCMMTNTFPLGVGLRVQSLTADCTLPDGRTCDVKTTTHPNGVLMAQPSKQHSGTNLYVLLTVKHHTFTFVGWASHAALCREQNLKLLRQDGIPCYCLPQERLEQTLWNLY